MPRYDEEEEFDAVKDVLLPKRVFLVLPPESPQEADRLRSQLRTLSFEAAFTSQQARSPDEFAAKVIPRKRIHPGAIRYFARALNKVELSAYICM